MDPSPARRETKWDHSTFSTQSVSNGEFSTQDSGWMKFHVNFMNGGDIEKWEEMKHSRTILLLLWQNMGVSKTAPTLFSRIHQQKLFKPWNLEALEFKPFSGAYLGANPASSPHKTCSWIIPPWPGCRWVAEPSAPAAATAACRTVPAPPWRGRRWRPEWLEVGNKPVATGLSLDLRSKTHSHSWHLHTAWGGSI